MELAGSLVSRGACPRGKTFYSCLGNRFSGCCSLDPCDLSDCPDDWAGESGKGRLGDRDQGGKGTTASSTKTDSGITHTVPNPSVVTVTRHTVVFSEAPSSTTVSAEDAATLTSGYAPTSTPAETASSATSSTRVVTSTPASNNGDGEAASLSSGAIVGTVAGGIVLGVVFVVLVIAWRRRKRSKAASDAGSVAAFPDGLGSSPDAEKPHEQQHRRPRSAHTTGSSDPFAPFGGRADVPPDTYRPPIGTFEMDGTGMAPVELPAELAAPSRALDAQAQQQASRPWAKASGPAPDPRANLNSIKTDSGHAAYVNHWDQ